MQILTTLAQWLFVLFIAAAMLINLFGSAAWTFNLLHGIYSLF